MSLASLCFFWGTTYLGIRVALEEFSPTVLVATRFLISGTLMLGFARWRGSHLPRGRELWLTAAYGLLTLGVGNSCLAWAEQLIPSGMASIFITTSPFWMVGLDAAMGGPRLKLLPVLGMLAGFGGTVLLVGEGALREGLTGNTLKGFVILQFSTVCWVLGSLLQRRQPTKAHPIVGGAVQQLVTGLAFLGPALVAGEGSFHGMTPGVLAILYLVVFGSIVGYSSYVYALDKLPVALVSLYNFINPVVAVSLGWLFYREPFGWRETAAMAVIFTGVTIVRMTSRK